VVRQLFGSGNQISLAADTRLLQSKQVLESHNQCRPLGLAICRRFKTRKAARAFWINKGTHVTVEDFSVFREKDCVRQTGNTDCYWLPIKALTKD
jgi:hypothetical protein